MLLSTKNTIAVIGSGPAGLAAAETLAESGYDVIIFERMSSPARKFLYAGRGGLNLTHSEAFDRFLTRYEPCSTLLLQAIKDYPPDELMNWSRGLGEETFIGSSGRVFPKTFKATRLLRAWLARLDKKGVRFAFRHEWIGWNKHGDLCFKAPEGLVTLTARATLLALGGASWPRLGSNGSWIDLLSDQSVDVKPLIPANMGFKVSWSEHFCLRFEGFPLKAVAMHFQGQSVRGEAVITRSGIEGGAIYALGRPLRDEVLHQGHAMLNIDLKPELAEATLAQRLSRCQKGQSIASLLRKGAALSPLSIALLRETSEGPLPNNPIELAKAVKTIRLKLTGIASLERAISTSGGICFSEIHQNFMISRIPGVFVAGEMLDWEAPTGGYLLQGCFATGHAAARGMLSWLQRSE